MNSKRHTFDDDFIAKIYATAESRGLSMSGSARALLMGIELSQSAEAFDRWIVRLFKSLDGSNTHWAMPRLRKSALRYNLGLVSNLDHFKSPRFDPMRMYSGGLKGWEWAVQEWGDIMIVAKALKLPQLAELAAAEVGLIMAARLLKGDFGALRIASAGLLNIKAGKPFKARPGRKESHDSLDVFIAFLYLEQDGNRPSQAEVKSYLEAQGKRIRRDRISRAFAEHDLKERASDAREAISAAGQRRRRKA